MNKKFFAFYNTPFYSKLAVASLIAYLACTLYFAFVTDTGFFLDNIWDKLKHTVSFFGIYILLHIAFYKWPSWMLFLIAFCYGMGIEVVQTFLPHRYPSLLDMVANLIGIFLGMFFLQWMKYKGRYHQLPTL